MVINRVHEKLNDESAIKKPFYCCKKKERSCFVRMQDLSTYLQGIDDCLYVRFNCLMGELRAGKGAHAFQGQVAQVGLSML